MSAVSPAFAADAHAAVARLRALEQRAAQKSGEARPLFEQRGQLLPRERLGLLLDPGAQWLPLCGLAGYLQDDADPERSTPGAGLVAGVGFVRAVRCVIVASDAALEGGVQPMRLEKMLRLQEIALANRLPFVQLAEGGARISPGPREYEQRAAVLRNFARLTAAGVPVVTLLHGPCDLHVPGLGDVVVAVGAGDYGARDDREAIGMLREVLAPLALTPAPSRRRERAQNPPSLCPLPLAGEDREERAREGLLRLISRAPIDPRGLMLHLADDESLLEFQAAAAPAVTCTQARISGHPLGFIANGAPLDVAAATKAAQFIRWMDRLGHPIVHLQAAGAGEEEPAGALVQAITQATVPQLTVQCAGGHPVLCGRAFAPRFLFRWPGGEGAEAWEASGLVLDDGVIDPRDTRAVLAFCLDTVAAGR